MKKHFTRKFSLVLSFLSILSLSCFGQVIYSTQFDGGLDGWTTENQSSADVPDEAWMHVPNGTTTQFNGALNSTTSANGHALYNAISLCPAAVAADTKQDAWLISPEIDASANGEVWLSFETLYAEFNSKAYVEISTDGGATFPEANRIDMFPDIGVNTYSHGGARSDGNILNPHLVIVDLTTFAANQANLVVALRYLNSSETIDGGVDQRCGYAWYVDDVAFYGSDPTPAHDLALTEFFISPNARMPLSQADSIFFGGEVVNNGAMAQTNVMMNVEVTETSDGGNSVYTESFPMGTIEPGGIDSVWYEGLYIPTDTGTYLISYSITADSMDLSIGDNTAEEEFLITTNQWAKEAGTGVSPIWANGTNRQGTLYDMFNPGDYATDARIALTGVNGYSLVGETVTIRLQSTDFGLTPYNDDNLSTNGQSSYTFTQADDDANPRFVTVPLLNTQTGCVGVELEPNKVYVLTVEYPMDDNLDPKIAPYRSASHNYQFQNESAILLRNSDGTFFGGWVSGAVPLVRMDITDDPTVDLAPVAAFTTTIEDMTLTIEDESEFGCDYLWDFGDGGSSFSQNPSHTYTADGNYVVCLEMTNDFGTSTLCDTVTVGVVSTIDLADANKIEIAPNPVKDMLTLNVEMTAIAETASIKVTNLTGKVLIDQNFDNVLNRQFTFDVQNFAAGTYFLNMTTEEGSTTQKFTVQK